MRLLHYLQNDDYFTYCITIISLIVFGIYYFDYLYYITIIRIIGIIAINFLYPHLHINVVYGFRLWLEQPQCIRIHPRQLSQQNYCDIQVVGAPPFWPAPPRNRRLALSLTPRSYTSGTLQSSIFGRKFILLMHCRENQLESSGHGQSRR